MSMALANRFEKACTVCGVTVVVGAGYVKRAAQGMLWSTYCKLCSGVVEDAKPTITVSMVDGMVAFKPTSHLGADVFARYRTALDGAKYVKKHEANVVPVAMGARMVANLHAAGFVADVASDVRAAIETNEAALTATIAATDERLTQIDATLAARGQALYDYQRPGIQWLAARDRAVLADDMGLGKAQPHSEPVLTPSGWRRMGDLNVGDEVVGSNGKPCRVLGIYEQGVKPVYQVTLSDGATTRCCIEHLWAVQTPNDRVRSGRFRVKSLQEIMSAGLFDNHGNKRWFVPMLLAVEFVPSNGRPVHPYLLGALIANGSLGSTTVHSGDAEQRAAFSPHLPEGLSINPTNSEWSYRIASERAGLANPLTRAIKELLLSKTESQTKFVPKNYLYASVEDRIALLRGLMDNDGTISEDGMTIEYNTSSPQLADDVLSLVRSLGGSAWMSTRKPTYTHKGAKMVGQTDHRVRMAVAFCPFAIPRKVARYVPRTKYKPTHAIASIVAIGEEECRCIAVDTPDHLYVTNDYILTHNTSQTLLALPTNAPIVVVCPAVAKGVWEREVKKWRPEIRTTVLSGEHSYHPPVAGEMVIINYDVLPEDPTHVVDTTTIATKDAAGGVEALRLQPGDTVWIDADSMDVKLVCAIHTTDGRIIDIRENTTTTPLHCDSMGDSLLVWETSGDQRMHIRHSRKVTTPAGLCVVADEAHLVKGGVKTQRGERMRKLCTLATSMGGRQYALTGTPLLNNPIELWKVLECFNLANEAFGDWWGFTRLFNATQDRWGGWHFGTPLATVGERLARVMLRRVKGEVLKDLPPKRWESLTVDIDEGMRALCDAVDISAVEKALKEGRKVAFKTISKAREALARAKTASMLEMVKAYEESGTPVLVFSAHTYPIKQLAKRKGWATITGDTTTEDRTRIENEFQAGGLVGVGLTIDAGGVAITLTRASHEIFVDQEWTPALNTQAEDRAHRIGQANPVVITTLVADHPLDERIAELLTIKSTLVNASVEMARTTTAPKIEATNVDFTTIAIDAATELVRRVDAEALAAARAAEIKARIEAEEAARPMVTTHDGKVRKAPREQERYAAITAQEAWAHAALVMLEGLDPDGATVRNEVGFNGADGFMGHRLATKASEGLTAAEWRYAIKMCCKYHRQIGACPKS